MLALAIGWLIVFGGGYAIFIARRPFEPVWLEVVVGVVGTLFGMAGLQADLCRREAHIIWILIAPAASFVLTGAFTILAQIRKQQRQLKETERALMDTGPLRGRK